MSRVPDVNYTTVRVARETHRLMERIATRRRWKLGVVVDEAVKRLLAEDEEKCELVGVTAAVADDAKATSR